MYAFTQDVPIDEAAYKRIVDGLGPEPPKGLVSHIAVKRREGGLRYIDVWESEEDWDRFAAERLHPVVLSLRHRHDIRGPGERDAGDGLLHHGDQRPGGRRHRGRGRHLPEQLRHAQGHRVAVRVVIITCPRS